MQGFADVPQSFAEYCGMKWTSGNGVDKLGANSRKDRVHISSRFGSDPIVTTPTRLSLSYSDHHDYLRRGQLKYGISQVAVSWSSIFATGPTATTTGRMPWLPRSFEALAANLECPGFPLCSLPTVRYTSPHG